MQILHSCNKKYYEYIELNKLLIKNEKAVTAFDSHKSITQELKFILTSKAA